MTGERRSAQRSPNLPHTHVLSAAPAPVRRKNSDTSSLFNMLLANVAECSERTEALTKLYLKNPGEPRLVPAGGPPSRMSVMDRFWVVSKHPRTGESSRNAPCVKRMPPNIHPHARAGARMHGREGERTRSQPTNQSSESTSADDGCPDVRPNNVSYGRGYARTHAPSRREKSRTSSESARRAHW